jgi:hypothetical protein
MSIHRCADDKQDTYHGVTDVLAGPSEQSLRRIVRFRDAGVRTGNSQRCNPVVQ